MRRRRRRMVTNDHTETKTISADPMDKPAINPMPSSFLLDDEERKGYAPNDEVVLVLFRINESSPLAIEESSFFSIDSLEVEASSFVNNNEAEQVTRRQRVIE